MRGLALLAAGFSLNVAAALAQPRAVEATAGESGDEQSGAPRACADCLTPNVDLGEIGSVVWGYSQTGTCATQGKWYASFNGHAGLVYHFDLCPDAPGDGSADFDADIKICDASCTILAGDDGACPVGEYYRPNDFAWICYADGLYHVVVAPYRSYNQHSCTGTANSTFTLKYYAEPDPCTGLYPSNDTCEELPAYYGGAIPTLTAGVAHTFCGDNTCARADCTQTPTRNAWEAFTVTGSATGWDITLDYCGTPGPWQSLYQKLMTGCPCTSLTAPAYPWYWGCPDGNAVLVWRSLPDGTYYYPVQVDETNNSVGAYVLNVMAVPHVPDYCDASAGCNEYVGRVQVGTIDNVTGCSQPLGYGDYTGLVAEMAIGTTHPITVFSGQGYTNTRCAVWVDWNRDLDFTDVGETIALTAVSSMGPYVGTLIPPVDAALGPTRLRVRVALNDTPPPCGATTYGEVEDYTINVPGALPVGACCLSAVCEGPIAAAGCVALGGVYLGDGSLCTPNPCVGACCLLDDSCQETLDEAGCLTLGGIFRGAGTDCTPNLCSQLGQDCWNPKPIVLTAGSLPYVDSDTTCGRLNDYSNTCLGSYDSGADFIYRLTLIEDMCLGLAVDGPSVGLGIAVDTACPPGPTCLAYDTGLNPFLRTLPLAAGTYHLMIDTGLPTCSDFTLTIDVCPPVPPNDNCADALVVTDGAPAATGNNCGASNEGTATCQGYSRCDVWYRYTATASGVTGIDTEGSAQPDMILSVYDACGGTELACDDDSGTNLQARVSLLTTAGTEYWIRLASYGEYCGAFCLNIASIPQPPNDFCDAALIVTDGTPAATGDNSAATDDGAATCQSNSHRDVWYRYTATCGGIVQIDTEGSAQSDTVLSVYTACGGSQIACNDNGGTGSQALLRFNAVWGQEYWIRLASYGSSSGGFNLNIACTWPQGACCQPDGSCVLLSELVCIEGGGDFVGEATLCAGDCNGNGRDDTCDFLNGASTDCNDNGVPDECDIASGTSDDCQRDGIPDECQFTLLGAALPAEDAMSSALPSAARASGACTPGRVVAPMWTGPAAQAARTVAAGRAGVERLVPSQYATIQAAIDAADEGDVVIVADGVYTGTGNRDIDFLGKTLTVRSANGPLNCIIDCQGTHQAPHRGFRFHHAESCACVVDGFTIQHGFAPDEGGYIRYSGGAILCRDNANPTIRNCILRWNQAPY